MPKKAHVKAAMREVVFACKADPAESAALVGTFNDWDPEATPMNRDSEGKWTAKLDLAPGTYQYKFVVDGVWCCEPGVDESEVFAADSVPNPYGTRNLTIEVS